MLKTVTCEPVVVVRFGMQTPGLGCGVALGTGTTFGFEGTINDVSSHASFGGVGATGSLTEVADSESQLYQLTLNYDVFGHTLTSVTAYHEFDLDRVSDIDNTPISIVTVHDPTEFEQWSQELRLTSPTGERFEYLVGLYWQTEDLIINEILNISLFNYEQTSPFFQEADSVSAFGSLTWNITDDWRTTFGLRYTEVEKDLARELIVRNPATGLPDPPSLGLAAFLGTVPHPLTNYSRSDDDLTPSINVQYDLNKDVMLYASYNAGFKAGGFDHRSGSGVPADIAFEPEEVDAYEIGAKTTWMNDALQLNLAVFRNEFENLQVSVFSGSGITFFVDNAASSTTQGVELDARWAVTENLNLSLAAAYLDATYDDFPVGPCHFLNTSIIPSCSAPPFGIDFAGKPLPYAPDWSGNFILDHVHHFKNGWQLESQFTVSFTDEFFTRVNLDPRVLQDGYGKLDARIALSGSNWELGVLGKNLTDKDTFPLSGSVALSGSSVLRFRDRQRYFLLQASYAW